MSTNRRAFLKQSAGTLGAASAAALLPASIRRALALPASNTTGTIQDVQHIIVLMQENRPFDGYFGRLAGVRGFNDRSTLPIRGQADIFHQPDGQGGFELPFHMDTKTTMAQAVASLPHGWIDGHRMWNGGRWDNWVPAKGPLTMGYFTRADIPFHYALADSFTVCDQYFSSCLGPTNTNRLHLMSGMIDVNSTGGGPLLENSPPAGVSFTWTTYVERLQKAGISWQIYQGVDGTEPFKTSTTQAGVDNPISTFNPFKYFPAIAGAPADSPLHQRAYLTRTFAQLKADIGSGNLPQISYLLPPLVCSEHPVFNPSDGATYIAAVLDALTAHPDVWSKTVLFVTYDENDGFFDHVVPPAPPMAADSGQSNIDVTGELCRGDATHMAGHVGPGPRVPMIVVSPWSKGAWTCSQVFDHTSIVRFMEKRFGVVEPNISPWRRAVCGDMMAAFDFSKPDASAVQVPSVAGLSALAASQAKLPAPLVPAVQSRPAQEPGTRNARALAYELFVEAVDDPHAGKVHLQFSNTGKLAAVFQVFSATGATSVKNYTVDAGTQLSAVWDRKVSGAGPAYDLTVLAPNGFLRRFRAKGAASASVSAGVCYEVPRGDLCLSLINTGTHPVRFTIADNRYGLPSRQIEVAAGRTLQQPWSLAESQRWYDVSVTVDTDASYLARFAGYVETGAPGVTDPSI